MKTFIPIALTIEATLLPTLPNPIMPIFLLNTSLPVSLALSHLPALMEESAAGICLIIDSIMAIVCSEAATVLPSGELSTTIPLSVAASTSILSTPTPALPITFSLSASKINSLVTFEVLLIIKAS